MHGLHLCGIACPESIQEIAEIAEVVTRHNLRFVGESDELSIGIGVTAGDSRSQSPAAFRDFHPEISPKSRLVVHAVRLPIEEWRSAYHTGIELFTANVQEVSGQTVPRSIKSRSRLHYWLAEQDERFVPSQCHPLLLNADGNIAESPTATIVIVDESRAAMIAPELETILHGVTFDYVAKIASKLGMKIERDVISQQKLLHADEVLWLSTPQFVLPVTQMDGKPIANGKPGRRYREILNAIESDLGIDLRHT